ncbi:MAG TPA: hypothetical protein VMD58_06875 [Acidobacteriaceae bacterium]|nr:hypothetical protein [Acidobacteriaceae bacterium]
MFLDVVGGIIVATHVIVISMIVLWFASGKPKSWAQFWAVFKEQMLGIKTPKGGPSAKA